MKIKSCSKNDIAELLFISIQSYTDHYTHLWHDQGEFYIDLNFNRDRLLEELADPNALFYLLYFENSLIGYLKLNADKGFENYQPADALELERIYLIKKATGKGIGKMVIDFVDGFARKKNKKIVWLKAMDSSKSVDFYRKQQFNICSEFYLTFSQMKDEYKRMFVMYKEI